MIEKVFVRHYTHVDVARLLGPEDFEGYDYNRPGPNWQLMEKIENAPECKDSGEPAWSANVYPTRAEAETE